MDQPKATVLCIDDDPADLVLITRTLMLGLPRSYDFLVAESLEAGYEVSREWGVDLVVVDLGLRLSSGSQTVRRAVSLFPAIPIVVLTGNKIAGVGNLCIDEGAEDFVPKTRLATDLARAVEFAIRRRRVSEAQQASFARIVTRLTAAFPATEDIDGAVREVLLQNLHSAVDGESRADTLRRVRRVAELLHAEQMSPMKLLGLLFASKDGSADTGNVAVALLAELGQAYFEQP
ncbi:MAG: response regulator [Nannocystales bacterium]